MKFYYFISYSILIWIKRCYAQDLVCNVKDPYKLYTITNQSMNIISNPDGCNITLSGSKIPLLGPDIINYPQRVLYLDLSNTGLQKIETDGLNYTNAVELRLDHNSILRINDSTFAQIYQNASFGNRVASLPNLSLLHLNDNPLTEIHESAFNVLPKLKKLFLMHTQIVFFIIRMSVLANIYLASVKPEEPCKIQYIQMDQDNGYYTKGPPMVIDANGCPISFFEFNSEEILLDQGTQVIKYYDGGFHKVVDLSLNKQKVQVHLAAQNFTLHFSGSGYEDIDRIDIIGAQHVINLDLSNNLLQNVNLEQFTKLETVNLSKNSFTCFEIPKIDTLSEIDLRGNNLDYECAQNLSKFKHVLMDLVQKPKSKDCQSIGVSCETTTIPVSQNTGWIIFEMVWTCILFTATFFAVAHSVFLYLRWRKTQYLAPINPIINQNYNELENDLSY